MENAPELICAARIVTKNAWKLSGQIHPRHEMTLVVDGRMRVTVGECAHEAGPGQIVFYRAGVRHDEEKISSKPLILHGLTLTGHMPRSGNELIRNDKRGRLTTLSGWLIEEWMGRNDSLAKHFFAAFLGEWRGLENNQDDDAIRAVRDYVREHSKRLVSLDELARVAGRSRAHFCRWYKARTGQTVFSDVMRMKTEMVKHLLLSSTLPLKQIAEMTGFADPYHLSKVFLKYQGRRPSNIRATQCPDKSWRWNNQIHWKEGSFVRTAKTTRNGDNH
ncbi:AraC family transcriptional regulator [Oscillatoria laete-virens NRMC-F 0139]|nr:AraC family transcriptional regulator [Oscillatoria laete-virens]MDL5055203.1 AraC family transcriptional regulator [Oscillatoria laete-virens NRMC-F 0139]